MSFLLSSKRRDPLLFFFFFFLHLPFFSSKISLSLQFIVGAGVGLPTVGVRIGEVKIGAGVGLPEVGAEVETMIGAGVVFATVQLVPCINIHLDGP